ncbi:MAG: HisKA protein [Chloroflexota bacterium]|nr:HisKA protein [Chloroflexota bacterium]
MNLADWLEVLAQAVSALLAVWLGLTVALRSRLPVRRIFTFIALVLATWSSAIIVQRLGAPPSVSSVAQGVEELMAALALGGLAHFALEIATDGRPARRQQAVIATVYAILLLFAIPNIVDRGAPVSVSPPHLVLGPIPGAVLGWAWVAARLAAIGLGAWWLIAAMRSPDPGTLRRRQLRAALATIAMAGFGAALRFLPVIGDADRWIGTSFITLAVVCAAYAVFAAGIFFGPTVAARAFRTSVTGGVLVGVLIVALLGIELLSTNVLGIEGPYFLIVALVAVAAVYGPLSSRYRDRLGDRGSRAVARDRLLRALGEPTLTASPAAAGVGPALAHLARALDVTGVAVASTDGSVIASRGTASPGGAVSPLPLLDGEELVGELRVGESVSGAPLDARDLRLLDLSAAYFAGALRTGRREDEQASELAALAEARAMVDSHAEALHAALVERRDEPAGLRVFALGPLRMERGGTRIEHWGGDKAGSRQAQGLFAFLYDRGERGVAKDEVLELIWPDVDLERADLAFHRTMAGLRATLDPDKRRGGGAAIRFANDRYRLDGSVVAWSDVDAFLAALEAAATADGSARVRLLEEARRLCRGEYLDDCPYYGDSVFVEERRTLLRSRFVDLLVALGEAYEASADRMSAAAAFREAITRSPDGCPPAVAGLARLGL